MHELMKSIDELSPEETEAFRERMVEGGPFWSEHDALVDQAKALRERVQQPIGSHMLETIERHTYTRDDVITALNYAESTRFFAQALFGLAAETVNRIVKTLRAGVCAYCQWRTDDPLFSDRDLSEAEIAACQQRVAAAIREHVRVCPNHPMRALEARHSDADATARALKLAADSIDWALDLMDMYDERLVKLGDPRELVYSEVHVAAKAKARGVIAALRGETP